MYDGKYKIQHDKWYPYDWICTLKYRGVKVEESAFTSRGSIRRANRAMKKALKIKEQFEKFKSQVCE